MPVVDIRSLSETRYCAHASAIRNVFDDVAIPEIDSFEIIFEFFSRFHSRYNLKLSPNLVLSMASTQS